MLIYVYLYILIYHTLHSPLSYAKIVTGYAFYTLCKFLLGTCYSLSTVLRYSGKSDPTMFQCIFFSITVNQTCCSYLCLSGDSAPGCCLSATYLCPSILQQALTVTNTCPLAYQKNKHIFNYTSDAWEHAHCETNNTAVHGITSHGFPSHSHPTVLG